VRTGHGVGPVFGPLVEKIPFFHSCTSPVQYPTGSHTHVRAAGY
jgi:hypothetical protein